jgi:hypothetical protein
MQPSSQTSFKYSFSIKQQPYTMDGISLTRQSSSNITSHKCNFTVLITQRPIQNMKTLTTTCYRHPPVQQSRTRHPLPTVLALTYVTYSNKTYLITIISIHNSECEPATVTFYFLFFECTGMAVCIRSIWPLPLPPLRGDSVSRRHGTGLC